MTNPTREEKRILNDKEKYLVHYLTNEIKESEKIISRFKIDVELNCKLALEWSEDSFKASASIHVNTAFLKLFNLENLETVKSKVLQLVIGNVSCYSFSTSQTGNLMEQYENKAWAKILGRINEL